MDLTWLGPLVAAIGPTAAAFALVAGVIFYFYRRDHIIKQVNLKEDRDRMIQVISDVTQAVNRVAETQRSSAEAFTRGLETIVTMVGQRKQ